MICHLYLKLPNVFDTATNINHSSLLHSISQQSTQADIVTHRVLSSMMEGGRLADLDLTNCNVVARKVASQHPHILLRQLPLLVTMLQGKLQMSYLELRNNNVLSLFNHLLNLLDLLRPHLFDPSHHTYLTAILNVYLKLILNHGLHNKVLGGLINKFFDLLTHFSKHQPIRAHHLLRPHQAFFENLGHSYPHMHSITTILTILNYNSNRLTTHLADEGKVEDDEGMSAPGGFVKCGIERKPEGFRALNNYETPSIWPAPQCLMLQKKMMDGGDLSEVVRELDECSKFKIEILQLFVGNIEDLMTSKQHYVREVAHNLAMRLVRFNPSFATRFVKCMHACLISSDQHVQGKALSNLKEFSCFAREHAPSLLRTAFRAALSSQCDVGAHINHTLQLFNLNMALN